MKMCANFCLSVDLKFTDLGTLSVRSPDSIVSRVKRLEAIRSESDSWQGLNPNLCSERPATNHLRNDMTPKL